MSVLLEALKKAAEDKKRAQEASEQPIEQPLVVPEQKPLVALLKKESNSNIDAISDSIEKQASEKKSPSLKEPQHSGLQLKLNSKNISNDAKPALEQQAGKSQPNKLKPDHVSVSAHDLPEANKSELKLVLNEPPADLKPLETVTISEVEHQADERQDKSTSEVLLEQNDLEKKQLQESELEVEVAPVKTSESVSESKPMPESIPELILEPENELISEPKISTAHASNESNIKDEKKSLDEGADSYKWSFASLPGYLGLKGKLGDKKRQKEVEPLNPILVSGALSENPNRNQASQKSFKLVLILLMILVFIGILFYGFIYYQEQHDQLENRMKKYNLVKAYIENKEVTTSQQTTDNSDLNNRVIDVNSNDNALNEKDGTEALVSSIGASNVLKAEMKTISSQEHVAFENTQNTLDLATVPNVLKSRSEGTLDNSQIKPSKTTASSVTNTATEPSLKTFKPSYDNRVKTKPNTAEKKANVIVHTETDILLDAYLSYEEGDYLNAKVAFIKILDINPKNEFALIGLGNLASIEQQYATAMAYYQQVLMSQPSNLNAFEAIANISSDLELNSDWKDSLLDMVRDHPTSAVLQYSLGNLYAGEQDWLAAQQAYFQAYSLETNNADYVVNLAISLDQLGQYKLAAQHYTEALSLVDLQVINFDEVQVKNRLVSIRQFISGRAL